jgi:signal transduction histidine kinase
LHQILDNLMDNAVKYAPAGSTIMASARMSGGSVEAVVSNPAGPHRPDPDRMFDRFYRADIDESGNLRLHLLLPAAKGSRVLPVSASVA